MKKTDNTYTKKIYTRSLKPQVRIICGIFGLLFFLIMIAVYFVKINKVTNIKTITYTENSKLDYKVYLKPNSYFEEEYLDSGIKYIASIINSIKFNFKYNFEASRPLDYKYKYYIDAEVNAYEKGDSSKTIYTKKERLQEPISKTANNAADFYIDDNIDIDYVKYNNFISSLKKDYVLSLDSKLVLTFTVETIGSSDTLSKDITNTRKMKVIIPLSEQTINIDFDFKEINNKEVIEPIEKENKIIKNVLVFSCFIVGALINIYLIISIYIRMVSSRSAYSKKLSKIMREYDKVIVKTKNLPILDDYKVVEVETFEEMLDARDTLDSNILYEEVIPKKKSVFLIVNNNLAYLYILSEIGENK